MGHDTSNVFHLDENNQASAATVLGTDYGSNAFEVVNSNIFGTGIWGEGGQTGIFGIAGTWSETPGYSVPIGVLGYTQSEGFGLVGETRNGMAGVFANSGGSGAALQVTGKAVFSRSGKTAIAAGLTKKDVAMTRLTSATLVTATVQGVPITGLYVASVQVQPSMNKFTIHLSKAVPAGKTVTIGWFVVN